MSRAPFSDHPCRRCDIILAAPNANFGQPEINLGVIPGAGGSQRLTHALGKSLSMEIVLTGKNVTADDAERHGLISRVVREGDVVEEAIKVGATIAKKGQVAVQAAKEAVNACESWHCSAAANPRCLAC